MSAIKEITSLEEIRERKAAVQAEIDRSKKAAVNQLQETASEARTFVLQDVVLPAVGIAASAFLLTKVVKAAFGSDQSRHREPRQLQVIATENLPPPAEASSATENHSVPAPRVVVAPPQKTTNKEKGSLLSLGALLVPAGRAILEVIRDQQRK